MDTIDVVGVGRSFISSWHQVLNLFGWSIVIILLSLSRSLRLTFESRGRSEKGNKKKIKMKYYVLIALLGSASALKGEPERSGQTQ
jgi:hypothetical protein